MKTSDFAGTGTLFKLFLHRDRFLLPMWVVLPMILCGVTAATFTAMASQGLQSVLAEFHHDPLISALLGPVMSFDLPGAIVWRGSSQLALTLGLGSLLTIIRHTRADEETGRSELISSYVVGPYASLTAALSVTVLGNLVAGLLIAWSVISLGGNAEGSLLFGATMAAVGCFFAGIGAIGVQVRESSSTARGIGITAIGLGLGMSILNNFGGGLTLFRWLTPMAWQRLTHPFAGNHGWALLYCMVLVTVPIVAAYILSARRDLGAGVLLPRPGPAGAAPHFSSLLALAWRLQKRSFTGWLVATCLYIAVFAAISPGLSNSGGMSSWLSNLGGTGWAGEVGLGYVFISVSIYLISLFVAVYAINAVLQLKKEETEGRVEILVDKQVSRMRWMSSHLIVAALCSAVLLVVLGAIGGAVYGLAGGNLWEGFWRIFALSISKIPPVWTLFGLTAFLYGVWPHLTGLAWVIWLSFSLLEFAWEAQVIDWAMMRFSPFSYAHYTIDISNLPLLPLLGLLCLSLFLTGVGFVGFKNRDVLTKA